MFQHLEYFPFGETFVEENSRTEGTPYLFTGKELDSETGLYYFGARYYDPRTSIWASPDPILAEYLPQAGHRPGDIQGYGGVLNPPNLNLYGYVHNRPVVGVDPNGEFVWFIPIALLVVDVAFTSYELYSIHDQYRNGEITFEEAVAKVGFEAAMAFVPFDKVVSVVGKGGRILFRGNADEVADFVKDNADEIDGVGLEDARGFSNPCGFAANDDFWNFNWILGSAAYAGGPCGDLPVRDGTGKVHGDLPQLSDLNSYETDDLVSYRDDLERSVQTRIEKNSELGSDLGHAQRQAEEQAQISRINKILSDRGVE